MSVSTIPAPVAAEISGIGSFFGSCQIAAGGFESLLQSASVMTAGSEVPAVYGVALETPTVTNSDSDIEVPKLANVLSGYNILKEPELLARLQEILGEEAGAEAFEFIKNFFQKYKDKFTAQEGKENPEPSEMMRIFFRLQGILDSMYMPEMPIEEQQVELLESVLKEIKKLLGYEQIAQPEEEELLQPQPEEEELLQPQPETEMPQPEAKAEIAQPETEILQPEAKAEIAQPETEMPQPEAKTEIAQLETEILQPEAKTKIAQPEEEELLQPQPKAETEITQPETDKLHFVKIEDPRITRLAIELGIDPLERGEFYKLINYLLEQGLISLEDLGEPKIEDALIIVTPENEEEKSQEEKNNEKKETNFFIDTLKDLWESIKNGDTSKKEEFLSLFKEITCVREFSKQLKESVDTEQKTDVLNKDLDSISTSKKEDGFKDYDSNLANLVKTKFREGKQEKQAQPEVRAVWEGNGLKIEVVNPKTGEKLQSVPATSNTQERMNEYEVIRQVIARAKLITTPKGEQRLTIQLRPEHLGQLDLRIILNRGEMQIHARVESATAQQALENHIGLLREGLEKQGITLERLEISIEQKDGQDAWSLAEKQERHEQKQGNRRHRHGRESHLAVSIANDANADTGRRLGYNTMEYLA